ncbi:MAG: hypothetical protein H5T69_16675 [Chloroflexi bacterium]|nr:hypothetical protein [Chloroflexota bacterium]
MASVLAWVVLTQDAQRRELAARYIATLLDDEHLPLWLQSSYHLPLRRSLLSDVVGENAELEAFLDAQMRHAFPYPAAPHRAEWEAALLRAIQDTLDGLSTPERAALAAATNIARLR